MKKTFALAAIAVLTLGFASCTNDPVPEQGDNKLPYASYEEYKYAPNRELTGGYYDASMAVKTKYGTYVGWEKDGVYQFYGIPYAQQPVGELRFRKPQPLAESNKVFEAYHFAHSALQVLDKSEQAGFYEQGEDCLALNIWTSSITPGANRPVMVFIHGGGYAYGGSADPIYNGRNFVRNNSDIVMVTINYRLNLLGYLDTRKIPGGENYGTNGNQATLDQIAAVKWVRENIEAFGGNPDNITVFGESAGCVSAGVVAISPYIRENGKPIIKNVIMESAGLNVVHSDETARLLPSTLLSSKGITSMQELESMSTEELFSLITICFIQRVAYGPVADGDIVPLDPLKAWEQGLAKDINMLAGINSDECDYFAATNPIIEQLQNGIEKYLEKMVSPADMQQYCDYRDQYYKVILDYLKEEKGLIDITTDSQRFKREISNEWFFFAAHNIESKGHNIGGGKSYFYFFDYVTEVLKSKGWGCYHAAEVPFIFESEAPDYWSKSAEEMEVSHLMQTIWANFARTGNPSFSSAVNGTSYSITWPEYTDADRQVVCLDLTPRIERDFRRERADLSEKMLFLSPTYHWSEFYSGIELQ